jgi:hypothetical protein
VRPVGHVGRDLDAAVDRAGGHDQDISLGAGQSFAIAASEARGVIDQIKARGNLDYIGLNGEVNPDNTGIAVVSVAPGSPADKAGIVAGDLLTDFNGTAVGTDGTKSTYCSVLRSHNAGDTLTFAVTRGGQTLTGEINGRPIAVTSTPAPATPAPVASAPAGSPTVTGSIDRLEPFVPAAIWSTCAPAVVEFPTIAQAGYCLYPGTDGVWYDLYSDPADLQATFDTYIKNNSVQPSTNMATDCARGNWSGAWNWNGQAAVPGDVLICAKDAKGNAWMAQADSRANVMFIVQFKNGDQPAAYKWWLDNATIVKAGN